MRTNNQSFPAVQEANHVQSFERGSVHEKRRLRTPLAILLGFVLALSGTSILGLTPSVQAAEAPVTPPVTCTGAPIMILSVVMSPTSGTTNDKYSFTVKTSRAAYNVEFTFSGSGGTSHAYATVATTDKMTWTLSNYTFTTAMSSYTVTAQDSACGTVADPWSANINITTPTPTPTPSTNPTTNPTTKPNPTTAPTSVPVPTPTPAPVVYITLTFNGNGATYGSAPITTTIPSGSAYTMPGPLSWDKTGYSFAGWSTNVNGTGQVYSTGYSYTFFADTTLYAIWTENVYTITFNSMGGVSIPPQKGAYNSVITVPTTTRPGYVLRGWSTKQNDTEPMYLPGRSITTSWTGTLYAIWTVGITITFMSKGLSTLPTLDLPKINADQTVTVTPGSPVTMPGQQDMIVDDLTLVAWNTNPDGSGTKYLIGQSYVFYETTTLYPIWTAVITLYSNGGTSGPASNQLQVTPGAYQTIPSNGTMARTGYTFTGWNTQADGGGTNYQAGSSYKATKNLTLYAQWKLTIDLLEVSITGGDAPRIGQTLTAEVSPESLSSTPGVTFTYQWMSSQECPRDDISWNDAWSDLQTSFPTLRVSSSKNTFTVRSRDYLALVCVRVTAAMAGQNPVSRYTHSSYVSQPNGSSGASTYTVAAVSVPDSTDTTTKTRVAQYSGSADIAAFVYDISSRWSISGNVATLKSVSVANVDSNLPLMKIQQVQITGSCGLNNSPGDLWNNGDTPIRAIIDSPAVQVWPNSSGPSTVKCTIQSGVIGVITVSGDGTDLEGFNAPGTSAECSTGDPCTDTDGHTPDRSFSGRVTYILAAPQPAPGSNPVAQPTGISLSPSSQVVAVGASKSVTVTITPGNAADTTVYWSTSNPDVATVAVAYAGVSQIVNVTGVKPGSTVITARTENGQTATAQVNVGVTITYDANGGTGTPPLAQLAIVGSPINIPPASLSRTGYVFDGWNTTRDGLGTTYPAGSSGAFSTSTTLYAKWTPQPTVTISFNANGGSGTPASMTTNSDIAITLPAQGSFTRPGYTLSGWTVSPNGTGSVYPAGLQYKFSASTTLYAKWTALPVLTISFNANGGTGTAPGAKTTTNDIAVTLPAQGSLAKTGYTFSGWNTRNDGLGIDYAPGSSYKFSATTTLYAKWNPLPTLTINFSTNGGTGTVPAAKTASSDVTVTLPAQGNLAKTGFTFAGWNTQADGSGTTYTAGSSYKFTASTWLYAKWTALPKLTITFSANNGTGTPPSAMTTTNDAYITIPGQGALTRAGYTFAGWSTQTNGSGTTYTAGSSYKFSASTTLYAKWTALPVLTISFNANGGTGTTPGAKTTTNDIAVTLPVQGSLAKTGYTFSGWNTKNDGSGTDYTAGSSYKFSATTTLYAKWTPLTVTLNFSANNGTGTVPAAKTTTSDVAVTLPTQGNLAKTGFTFAGWNTQADGSGTTYTAGSSYKFTASTWLYAKWTALPKLTISFNVNGGTGTAPSSLSTTNDAFVTLPAQGNLVKTGFTFAGWSTQANGSGTTYAAGSSQKFSATTTLYAKWTALPKLTITFNANNGTGTPPSSISTTSDAFVTLPTQGNLTRTGFTFVGWNPYPTASGTTYAAGSSRQFYANVTLYATWNSLPVLTINFGANGGTGSVPTMKTVTSDVTVTLPVQGNLAKTGFTFAGWNTQPDGSGTTYTAGSSYKFTASTWLYAKWTALPKLTITFSANNGTGTPPSAMTTTNDAYITIPGQGTLTRTGYTFAGWSTQSNGSGTTYAAGSSQKFSASTTLYAKWTALPTVTITYNLNGATGTAPGRQATTSDVDVILPAQGNLVRIGYSFGGWNTQANGSGTTYVAGSAQKFSATTTLYAKWTPLPALTITFNANGGSGTVPPPMTTTSDAFIVLPVQGNLTKTGYSFAGWNTQANGLGTTYAAGSSQKFSATTTLYAKWALSTLTITFNANGGTGTVPTAKTTTSDSTVTMPDQGNLTRTGYTFAGWGTKVDGDGGIYGPGTSLRFTASTTMYAIWTPVTINFSINGGTGTAPAAKTATSASMVTLPTQGNLARTGYTFGGWNTSTDGSGTTYTAGSSYKFTASTWLYAKWNPLPTVTISFNANGGTGVTPTAISTTSDTSVTLPTQGSLVRTGYTFGGWNTQASGSGTTYQPGSAQKFSATTTLYAKWTALPTVTISFNLNGGTGVVPASISATSDIPVTLPTLANATRTGYAFGGWNTTANGTGTAYLAGMSVKFSTSTTLYATWTALPTLTIAYSSNGATTGSTPATQKTTSDVAVTLPVQGNLTKTGYTFDGWNTQSTGAGTTYAAGSSQKFSTSLTLFATWTPLSTVTISFDANGGTGAVYGPFTVANDQAIVLPNQGNLVRTGYNLTSWNTQANGSGTTYALQSTVKFSASTVLYAIWTPQSVTISYNANGGTGTVPVSTTVTSATDVVIPDQGNLSLSGYTFGGWNTQADGTGTTYAAGSAQKFSTSTVLYVMWNSDPTFVSVFFDGNGATSGATWNEFMTTLLLSTSDTPVTLPGQGNLLKTGYTFAGWNTKADGTGTTYQPGSSVTFTETITLHAVWTK